jgi:hypothetical protein
MRYFYRFALCVGLGAALTHPVSAQITGRVWHDANANGRSEVAEGGLPRQTVRAFDRHGQELSTTQTDTDGRYRLNVPEGTPLRLVFGGSLPGSHPTPGHARVRFVRAPAIVDLGLYVPAQYTGPAPRAVQSVFVKGNYTDLAADTLATLVSFAAQRSGDAPRRLATPAGSGSLWGLAYERNSQRLFASALAKRHSAFGPLGPGGLYVADGGQGPLRPFVSLDVLGIPTAPTHLPRDLSGDVSARSHDSLLFSCVGKISLGGLDVSEDGRYLFVLNLYDRKLYRIGLTGKTPQASDIRGFAVPEPGCRGGEARPFAVKCFDGKVYVGVVCDAQKSQKADDLTATVYAFEPGNERFREVFNFKLNYPRGEAGPQALTWMPWTDDYTVPLRRQGATWQAYPQPILADLEFDTDGSLILGLMDRFGHQTGDGMLFRERGNPTLFQYQAVSGGDVLRAAYVEGKYQLETNGRAGERSSGGGAGNRQGPGGGEFYFDDDFQAFGTIWHQESATGGLALLPERGEVLVSTREPETNVYVTGGVKWFTNRTGASTGGYSVFPSGSRPGYYWKSNNVGDVELLAEVPATELVHRVWIDCNENGLQDPDEAPLVGVRAELYRNDQRIATTQTNERGEARFISREIEGGLPPRTDYEVRIPLTQTGLGTLRLTARAVGADPDLDQDAVAENGYAVLRLQTTAPGEPLHQYDVGVACLDRPQVQAELICTGTGSSREAVLRVKGLKESERIDWSGTARYEGTNTYESARKLAQDGTIWTQPITAREAQHWTLRVFTPQHCFTDLFVRSADFKGCYQDPATDRELTVEAEGLTVSPNPSTGVVAVTYRRAGLNGPVSLQVVNLRGQVLYSQSGQAKGGVYRTRLDLTAQPSGAYRVLVQDGPMQTQKALIKK